MPDWYVEGPGRRVGYDDLTAIDWIFEYTKERQRRRKLVANSHGVIGSLRQLLDASQVWFVLVVTGISVGFVAAAISIASDWLGDIKTGFCKKGEDGGQFYLNKQFCCWGHDGMRDTFNLSCGKCLFNLRIGSVPGLDSVEGGVGCLIRGRRLRGRIYILHPVLREWA